MSERITERKVQKSCDRCSVELTKENTVENRGWMTKMTDHRFLSKGAVSRALGFGRPQIYVAEIHFCDACWWEFDRLFCQGQGMNHAPGVRVQPLTEGEHGRLPLTATYPVVSPARGE